MPAGLTVVTPSQARIPVASIANHDYTYLMTNELNPKVEYIVKNGVPSAVILPLAEYEELLEDLHDLAEIVRRKDEPLIPLAEVKRRLKSDAPLRR